MESELFLVLGFFVYCFCTYVFGNAPTCSQNLVFLGSLSCHVENRILMFLTMAKSFGSSLDHPSKFDGSITNSIANDDSLDGFNKFVASVGWFVTPLTSC